MARGTLPLPQSAPLRQRIGIAPRVRHRGWLARLSPSGDHRASGSLAVVLAGLVVVLAGLSARAQSPSANQPMAIDGMPPPPCPLLVPGSDAALQPLRLQPSQVARKNAVGCLSPADAAVYGADGCPLKLCHAPQGTVPLPQL